VIQSNTEAIARRDRPPWRGGSRKREFPQSTTIDYGITMSFQRASGILLHPTSLPSPFGIGDLGPEAYRFIDFLVDTRQQLWQILPLGPTGYGNSPYLCYSSMAGNHLLISLERLRDDGLLSQEDLDGAPDFSADTVDFDRVKEFKLPLLKQSCENFKDRATPEQQYEFQNFCDRVSVWLDDYALYMALKDANEDKSWYDWPDSISKREPEAMEQWKRRLSKEIYYHKYLQFEFARQWFDLKRYANDRRIQIFGDVAFYVAHDSADVWAHPDIFCLDRETGQPELMAGVPPDYFSATGQLWGNPVFNWEVLKERNFDWWVQRLSTVLDYMDLVRIDHFRGFQAYWAVPGGEETAMAGEWIEAPGVELFQVVADKLGKLPIVAEDLGIITPEVEALRDKFEFPGMKILHFAFDGNRDNFYLPFNYNSPNWVVYTGTHDNNTTVGWFNEIDDDTKWRIGTYIGNFDANEIHWEMIRLALGTVANQAIFPLQDALGLGGEARMNLPSAAQGNWGWRYHPEQLTGEIRDRLRNLTETYGRHPR